MSVFGADQADILIAWQDGYEKGRQEADRLREALALVNAIGAETIVEQRDQLRQRQARARGLAEAIRDLNEKSYSLTGLREVAAEIVELLSDATDKEPT